LNKAISINIISGIALTIFSFLAVVPVVSAAIADRDAQAAQKAPDTAEAHLKQANEAYASKKLGTAKDEAKRALKLQRDSPDAHMMLALVYRAQDKPKDAIKSVKEALKYRQNYAYAHYLLAILLYEQKKDLKQSAEEIDLAINQGLHQASAYVLKGVFELTAAKFESALEYYKKARELIPKNDPELALLQEQITALESYVEYRTHNGDSSVTRPKPLNFPRPNYTEAARQKRVQGVILSRILINEHGDVKSVLLVSRLGYGLDQQAIIAVSRLKFEPATKDGKPIPVWQAVEIEFRLK